MRRRLLPVAVLLLAAVPSAPEAAKVPRGPAGTSFYKPPRPLAGRHHGDLLRARSLHGTPALEGARWNRLILYRSRSLGGRPIAVSGTVAVPRGRAPRHGWPVLTWAHGTTGIGDRCAPSRDSPDGPLHGGSAYAHPLLDRYLEAGFAVVATDYQGLGTRGTHRYLVGREEGRSVLDIVRAARQLDRHIGRRVAIAGHSQGGQAALFAAALAPRWTPELRLRATVAFAPVSHLDTQGKLIRSLTSQNRLTGLVALILRGIDAFGPGVHIRSLLSTRARELYPRTLHWCLGGLGKPYSFGGMAPADLLRPGAKLGRVTKALGAAADPERLRIRTPVRVEQGTADTTVFKPFTDQLVKAYRARRGSHVSYRTWDRVDHVGVVFTAADDSVGYLKAHR
jgi:pimeloyl-ACP methyl ester carboxylesterase